ncbi:DNA-directed RNA polymerase III subunit rpc1-like [Pyrus ussuriensis x Pyrus communis]|uniref:DNA-directed RNA polymerase subunit n=1 Tax=Pyrus ussuriensis x Pyrus communis TaxID=2448454 RepID=A0A5N5GVV2_9ROSA|nr:DNA-directed RNA polymerase III subunit rpc1-like [Pyrus ussuriensis x Pyrus communis]
MKSANVKTLDFTRQPFIEPDTHHTVKELKFTVMSPAEIMKLAERLICATCGVNHVKCPGHFGYLALALPVYNIGYLGMVVNILKCICKNCSRFLLKDEMWVEYLRKMRNLKDPMKKMELIKIVVKKCIALCASNRRVECWKCGYVNGMVKKAARMIGILHDHSKFEDVMDELRKTMEGTKVSAAGLSVEAMLDLAKVFALLKEMSDEDCEVFYLSTRSKNLLITNILVPPTVIRPSVLVGGEVSNKNDITVRLKQIIQSNARLTRDLFDLRLGYAPGVKRSWDELQVEVAQYINSQVHVPFTMQGGNPLKDFVQRLKGKQGRFRGNLSAKCVEYTGRSVISPDPNLKISEVGVPIEMAQILTYPEWVTCHNIEKLRKCVCNIPHKYPGARSLHRDGEEFSLAITRISKNLADGLQYGDIVGRHLEDGDILLFNKQPSLQRMSFMSHRCCNFNTLVNIYFTEISMSTVMPWRTLRFNESVCNPYNADFDGDEMNIHVPQTEEAWAEAALLLGVENNLCTPKNGEILVASTQDFLTSSFLITRKDTFYDRSSFSLMCSYMGSGMDPVDFPTPAVIKPVEMWTGKQLFSVLVRPNANLRVYLNLIVTEKSYNTTKTEDGREIEAMCPNDGFVYFRNSVLIAGQLGKATLGNGNKNGLYYVLLRDYKPHAAAACMNHLAKLSAQWIGNHEFSIGISDVQPSGNLREEKEKTIKEGYEKSQLLESGITIVLNNIRDQTGKLCMQKLHWRNSPLIMSQCGSKGFAINISHMLACVGQQSVDGCRALNGFIARSLPHFPRGVKTPAAKGFVASSFYSSLSATEFFFHTMRGREGLVDTAMKTADTGYLSRRLTKVMEDLCVQYDKTVRNASGCILQFCYGDDAPLDLPRLFLKAKATCPAGKNEYMSPDQVSEIVRRRLSEPDMTPEAGCSVGFKTSLEEFLDEYVELFIKKHEIFMFDDDQIPAWKEKIVQNIAGVTSRQLEVFLDTCISHYHSKKIEGGTAIGIIGAQSICEPAMQMTLKTFHFAGVASMNITLGVPQIKEILDAVKNIHTPIITAALECDTKEKSARMVAGRIERTSLGQIAEKNVKVLVIRKLEVFPTETDRSKLYFRLHSLKNMLPSITVRGINTVKCVVINNEKEMKTNHKKYKLFTEGRRLLEVMGTEGVDECRTTSNDVLEVQRTFGIEAARVCIIEEIKSTMKQHGMNINCQHMICVGDVMTYMGQVFGLTRFEVKKMEKSVIALASFEQVADHLFNGCVNGRVDAVRGVSECIIMGVPIRVGTGMFNIREGGFSGSGAHDSNVELQYGPG